MNIRMGYGNKQTITNKNKKYHNVDYRHILVDFYQLQHTVTESHSEYVRRYAIIRLVTIVEQFFREIIVFKLSEGRQIKEKKIGLFKQHVITAIKWQEQVEPNVTSDDVWQDVVKFVDRHSEDGTKYDSQTEKITIPVNLLKEMICDCCKRPVFMLRHILVATSYSFQSTKQINLQMIEFNVFTDDDKLTDETRIELDRLFEARHILIHSMGEVNLDVRPYFSSLETLFQNTFEKIKPNQSYFDLAKGYAMHVMNRHEEAVKHLAIAGEYHWHDPKVALAFGMSLSGLGHVDDACHMFQHVLESSKPTKEFLDGRDKNYESTENALRDLALGCFAAGESACDLKNESLACNAWKIALDINPDSLKLYNSIGNGFIKIKEWNMALACFQKLIKAYPNNIQGHESLGIIYLKTNAKMAAEKEFKIAKQLCKSQEPST